MPDTFPLSRPVGPLQGASPDALGDRSAGAQLAARIPCYTPLPRAEEGQGERACTL
jgi:hypothetical protein